MTISGSVASAGGSVVPPPTGGLSVFGANGLLQDDDAMAIPAISSIAGILRLKAIGNDRLIMTFTGRSLL